MIDMNFPEHASCLISGSTPLRLYTETAGGRTGGANRKWAGPLVGRADGAKPKSAGNDVTAVNRVVSLCSLRHPAMPI